MLHLDCWSGPTWVGVVVESLETQRRFWGDLLGLPEGAAGSDFVHFDLGGGRSFELIERSQEPEYDRLRFQVGFSVRDTERARGQLLRRGVEPITDVIRGEASSWAYFRDAEGNVFEITERVGEQN